MRGKRGIKEVSETSGSVCCALNESDEKVGRFHNVI